MNNGKYDHLLEQYPKVIYLDQFYRLCRISKLSAAYLLKNGIVPYTDTGKSTWRYRILIDDVIEYLQKRERYGSMTPPGLANSRRNNRTIQRKAYAEYAGHANKVELEEYFRFIYSEHPEILSAQEVADVTGLSKYTVYRYIKSGDVKILSNDRRYTVLKCDVYNFMTSQKYIENKSTSLHIAKLLHGFELWKKNCKEGIKGRSGIKSEKL